MKKVYIVEEYYRYDNLNDSNITVFDTFEKAKKKYEEVLNIEKTESWVSDFLNQELDPAQDFFYLEETDTSFYCCDYDNEGNTTDISIVIKEVQ